MPPIRPTWIVHVAAWLSLIATGAALWYLICGAGFVR